METTSFPSDDEATDTEREESLSEADRLPTDIDPETVRKYFTLTDSDLAQVHQCRGILNKLGFAVLLCTLRWRGSFPRSLQDLPQPVLDAVATQVGVLPIPLDGYPQHENTRYEHCERIRQYLQFVRCDATQRDRLFDYLVAMAQGRPRATALRHVAEDWLQRERIVRPGRTTLRDAITAARETALQRVYTLLAEALTAEHVAELDAWLVSVAPDQGRLDLHEPGTRSRSRLEWLKTVPRKESPSALLILLDRLTELWTSPLSALPVLSEVHPATCRLLASWGYRYDVWSLRRFAPAKRHAIVLCFLQAARAETTDGIIDMQDKLITGVHNKARHRYEELLRASEEARTRAVEVLEDVGSLVLDDAVSDETLRQAIFEKIPSDDLSRLVAGCRVLRADHAGSPLGLVAQWYGYTRQYSPALLERMPFQFAQQSPLRRAIAYVNQLNRHHARKLAADAPIEFLPPRWVKHVVHRQRDGRVTLSRAHYEPALLTTLNERLKSGDVTVTGSRRWTDFEDYLIPRAVWAERRGASYAALGLPQDVDQYLAQLSEDFTQVAAAIDRRVPYNQALRINAAKRQFQLAALKGLERPDAVKQAKALIQSRLSRIDLVDLLIEMDHQTNMLRHFLRHPDASRLPPAIRRRNVLAALIAIGCNIGPQRMAVASGLNLHNISFVADWYLTEEALKAASVDLVNFATRLPMSRVYGQGNTCSADGMRFYVPVNILAADYSHVLHGRGVTLFAHTSDTGLRLHQQPIPCRLREAAFSLDGLLEHDTELNPTVCYTDTHGYTEVIMAAGDLLGFVLAPRIKDIKDQTLYKMDREQSFPNLDPILTGTIKPHLVRQAWDETVRVVASIQDRIVSASLILHRLGSYARQNSVHQALAEIGRVHKTIHILKTLDDEEYRRRMGRELNKGEASHALSRFLCFGKEGHLRGREFGDQLHTFSCLSVLHNAVVAWNTLHIGHVVEELRTEGHVLDEPTLALTTPLFHKHVNPYGRYHFDVDRMRQTLDPVGSDA